MAELSVASVIDLLGVGIELMIAGLVTRRDAADFGGEGV